MTIKEKLLEILENKGVTEYKFYKDTGVSRGTLANNSGLNADTLTKFFDYFPDIDTNTIFRQKFSPNLENSDKEEKLPELNDPNSNYSLQLKNDKEKIIHLLEEQVRELKKDKEQLYKIINK